MLFSSCSLIISVNGKVKVLFIEHLQAAILCSIEWFEV